MLSYIFIFHQRLAKLSLAGGVAARHSAGSDEREENHPWVRRSDAQAIPLYRLTRSNRAIESFGSSRSASEAGRVHPAYAMHAQHLQCLIKGQHEQSHRKNAATFWHGVWLRTLTTGGSSSTFQPTHPPLPSSLLHLLTLPTHSLV